ncbi:MAG: glycosyltransferase [Muribaculaceae bacterium]|nr:glycosyltransferase [Muribaculaceae bacterium]MDE7368977.1 glycosyltransferase [Muribaculaceae bacterium]
MENQSQKTEENQQSRPMVSVVMIAYNSSRYISQAIEGVVKQRHKFDVQLVICDDASIDNTAEIVEKWSKKYPGIIDYYRNEKNLGVQGNYLEAFKHCKGKYLTMCDADDYWCCHSKLARQVAYMEAHPECVLTYHRVINYYEVSGEMSLSNGRGLISRTPQELAASNTITNLSVMYRSDALDLKNLPAWLSEVRLIDYAMHMLYAQHGDIHYMSRPMGVYRHLPTAIWSLAEQNRRREMAIDVRKHLIEELADRPDLTGPLQESIQRMLDNSQKPQETPSWRRFFKICRSILSRLIPVPRP